MRMRARGRLPLLTRARQIATPSAIWVNRRLPGRPVDWGTLRRTSPFSDHYGYDRGKPIDRFYIERFLEARRSAIRGAVLEVGDPEYTRRFGGERVTHSHVVDIAPGNPQATLVADLCAPRSLAACAFDCVILTQTLQLLSEQVVALQNLWTSMRAGGALLVTVPCVSRVERKTPETDFWRYTPRGLELLIAKTCPGARIVSEGRGNVLAAVAFLMGLASEDLSESELEAEDPYFPLLICATVIKPEGGPVR
jgi:hypothetical protein